MKTKSVETQKKKEEQIGSQWHAFAHILNYRNSGTETMKRGYQVEQKWKMESKIKFMPNITSCVFWTTNKILLIRWFVFARIDTEHEIWSLFCSMSMFCGCCIIIKFKFYFRFFLSFSLRQNEENEEMNDEKTARKKRRTYDLKY